MGAFDSLKGKAEDLAQNHGDKLEGVSDTVIDKAGDAADKLTGGKFSDKIDGIQQAADDRIGG
ncbi:MAG: antitoxin [Actinomycetota bacterium]